MPLPQHRFVTYQVLCSSPDDLEAELDVFQDTLAKFAEAVIMPDWVLFPAATFRAPFNAIALKAAVESNIRSCDFFLQLVGNNKPDPVYLGFVDYAIQCATEADLPMRGTAVLFRESADTSELQHLLASKSEIHTFSDHQQLSQVLWTVFEGWYALIKATSVPRSSSSATQTKPGYSSPTDSSD